MKKVSSKIAFILISAAVLTSCRDTNKFPDTPHLEYRGYTLEKESSSSPTGNLLFELYFTDGNGDIGEDPNLPNNATCAQILSKNNLYVKYFRKANGTFVEIPSIDTCDNTYYTAGSIPDITPTGSNPTLEGTIYYNMDPIYSPLSDSVKFEFILKDRSGKISNIASTEAIIIQ